MSLSEYPEYLIGKSLSYGFHAFEAKDNNLEKLNSCKKSLGLRSGDQLVVSILRQLYRNDCFIEAIIVPGRVLIENLFCCPGGMVIYFHPYTGACLEFLSFQYPVFFVAKLMRKKDTPRKDIEFIKHSGREENSFSCMVLWVGSEFSLGKFKDRMSLIQQPHLSLNLLENSDTVIH